METGSAFDDVALICERGGSFAADGAEFVDRFETMGSPTSVQRVSAGCNSGA